MRRESGGESGVPRCCRQVGRRHHDLGFAVRSICVARSWLCLERRPFRCATGASAAAPGGGGSSQNGCVV